LVPVTPKRDTGLRESPAFMKTKTSNPLTTVRAKLLGAFLVLSLLAAGVGGFGLIKLSALRANTHQISEQIILPMTKATTLHNTIAEWQIDTLASFSGAETPQLAKEAADDLAKLPELVHALTVGQLPSDEARTAVGVTQKDFARMTTDLKVISNPKSLSQAESSADGADLISSISAAVASTTNLVAVLQRAALQVDTDSATVYHDAEKLLLTVLVGVLVFALAFGFVFSDRLVRPIKKTVAVLEDVANGDLTKRLDLNRSDEFGAMAVALNSTLGTVHDVIRQIESDASGLSDLAARAAEPTGEGARATNAYNNSSAIADLASMADNLTAMISIFTIEDETQPVPVPV
jgi:HAMP domain-containing protein